MTTPLKIKRESLVRKLLNKYEKKLEQLQEKQPEKIDAFEFKKKLKQFNNNIMLLQKQKEELNRKKLEYLQEKQQLDEKQIGTRSKLEELEKKIVLNKQKNKQKQDLVKKQKGTINEKIKRIHERKNQLNFKNEEQINDKILRLDEILETHSLSMREEKDLVSKIDSLKSTKNKFRQFKETEFKLKNEKKKIFKKLKNTNKDEKIKKTLLQQRSGLRRSLSQSGFEGESIRVNLVDVNDKIEKIIEKINQIKENRRIFRKEIQERKREYKKFENQKTELSKKIYENERILRDIKFQNRMKEKEKQDQKNQIIPSEILICDNLIKFLKLLLPKKKKVQKQLEKKENESTANQNIPKELENYNVFVKDTEITKEFKIKNSNPKRKKKKGSSVKKQQYLTIPFSYLTDFTTISIEPPKARSEIEMVIKKIEEEKKKYQNKNNFIKKHNDITINSSSNLNNKQNKLIKLNFEIIENKIKISFNYLETLSNIKNSQNINRNKERNRKNNKKRQGKKNHWIYLTTKSKVDESSKTAPIINQDNEEEWPSLSSKKTIQKQSKIQYKSILNTESKKKK
ncbi:nuclear segregation protein bfr1 [Anaeramoeba flamelloides]|uniref:Nuclear segregation protein bfr1 n=1 Tax=Anaeramoeba flamelloides TaxID=1746091 RepID=A0ABQ8X9D5_9EUKA|nr:nuclear segregation protein bfr1 [Anaeramoeba flamelloides]